MVGTKKKSKKPQKWLEEPSESRSITPSPPVIPADPADLLGSEKEESAGESPLVDVVLEEPIARLEIADAVSEHERVVELEPVEDATEHVETAAEHVEAVLEHVGALPVPLQETRRQSFTSLAERERRLSSQLAAQRNRTGMSPLISTSPSARSPPTYRLSTSPRSRNSLIDAPPLPQGHYFTVPDLVEAKSKTVRLDTLSDAGDQAAAIKAYDIVLVGTMGALDVYRVMPEKMEVIARLDNLRGMVLDAKIVPVVTVEDKHSAKRPLVAVLVHGPIEDGPWVKYQTTLEVYSLKTQEHVATLYRSLPITQLQDQIPEPVGQLKIHANGSYLALSSATSGEIFVFKDNLAIGKFWTTDALLSLGKRWLVIVPPDSSSAVSIQGTASAVGQPYGLTSYNAPMQPPLTADVDGVSQGMISRLGRQAAQELLKASRKGVELGISGWKEFTNPSPPQRESEFPPTNAPEIKKQDQPAVVSIVDLHKPAPICTFALEHGCSFLSLSPDLKLVTTDRTGEVSDVWEIDPYGLVKHVHRIERNSPSVVVGAAWSGDCLALQTEKTVHLHEVVKKVQKPWSWNRNKLLARGFSLAKTGVADAWHADDNKIRMSGDVRWIRGGLAVASTTNVYVYSVAKGERLKVEHGRRDFALPDTKGPSFWGLRTVNERPKVQEQDEIDTNPMYCPFHVDRRVSMLVYTPQEMWCFGEVLPLGVKVNTEEYDEFEETMERSVFRVDS